MAGSEITTSEINLLMNEAVNALGASDFTTAYTKALQAQGLMLAKPRSNFDRDELEWYPEKIDAFLNRIQELKRSASGSISGSLVQIPVRRQSSNLRDYDEC
jgi:hypothetical protein